MFAALNEYDTQSYFDGHPQMYLITPDGGYVMEVFSAFEAPAPVSNIPVNRLQTPAFP